MEKEGFISIREPAGIFFAGVLLLGFITLFMTSIINDERNPQGKMVKKLKKKNNNLRKGKKS